MFQQAVERDASKRPPAFVVESVGVVTEPARPARKEGLDHPQEMIVAALGTEAGARHPLLAGARKRHHRIARRAKSTNAAAQPSLDLGGRAVVGKGEACLRLLESRELGAKHVETCLDQTLGLAERHLGLVDVAVPVWHQVVAARPELVPEAEVALAPPVVPLFSWDDVLAS